MAFSYITDGETIPDVASCSGALFTKMVNNIQGILDGDPGAPRLKILAMPAPTAGNAVIREYTTPPESLPTTWTLMMPWPVIRSGTYRFRITLWNSAAGTFSARIYIDGAPFGAERNLTGVGDATWTEDLTLTAGTQINLYVRHTSGGISGTAEFRCGVAAPLRPIAKVL